MPSNNLVSEENEAYSSEDSEFADELVPICQSKISTEVQGPIIESKWRRKLEVHERVEQGRRHRGKDKAERATVESVLDPRTKIVLFKFIAQGTFHSIEGCISTGKEANVYHACANDEEMAVKVYQTSILTFKDRERYMDGDYRLRGGYSRHNNRKLVKIWALKEYRNLCRLHKSPVLCPKPIAYRSNVVVMTLIGKDGLPSPQLKQVQLEQHQARRLYLQICWFIRCMYHICKLVHADLSEYNLIYHDNSAYIIDVSQSVETDHPGALEYLYRDCVTMTKYFLSYGVPVLATDRMFEFVVEAATDLQEQEDVEARLIRLLEQEGDLDDRIINDPQACLAYQSMLLEQRMRQGFDLFSERVEKHAMSNDDEPLDRDEDELSDYQSSSSSSSASNSSTDFSSDREYFEKNLNSNARPRNETLEEKRARKMAVKEHQRECRQNKVPKHVKKRRKKLSKMNAKRK